MSLKTEQKTLREHIQALKAHIQSTEDFLLGEVNKIQPRVTEIKQKLLR